MSKAKPIAEVNCDGVAAEAILLVITTRFEEMCALRDLALDWSDPEGVHDMRVSSRRLRGALGDFLPYLHKRKLAVVSKQIQNIADALGTVRDQDVAIIGLQKVGASAPTEAATIINKLIEARESQRTQARRKLRQALHKGRLNQLQKDFEAAVVSAANSKPAKHQSKGSDSSAGITYREVGRRVIMKRLKELEKLSPGLYRPLKIKPLHSMRIGAKRFRYALELFEPCWGPEVSSCARKVAALQSSLGELHDADIWIQAFGEDLDGLGDESKERSVGALWLLSHFVKLHSKHLRNALGKWSEWEAKELGARLRQSLHDSMLAVHSEEPSSAIESAAR